MASHKASPVPWLREILNPDDRRLVEDMKKMSSSDLLEVIDHTVRDQRSGHLCAVVNDFVQWQRKEDRFEGTAVAPVTTPRHPYVKSHSDFLIADLDSLPFLVNDNGLTSFLAADAEFVNDLRTNDPYVVMFSAVQIPLNRGIPVPKVHVIVNPDLPGNKFYAKRWATNTSYLPAINSCCGIFPIKCLSHKTRVFSLKHITFIDRFHCLGRKKDEKH